MSARPVVPTATKRAVGVEAHVAALKVRRNQFLELHDFTIGHGLEVGPLDSGITDRDIDDVRYVDVFDTAGTRRQYADDDNVIIELIGEIDYPLSVDGILRPLSEAAAPGAPYDWVIASHVIEHVPDVIAWLEELAQVTVDGGVLLLAVPDRRFSFDRHRPPTTTGQILDAHERGDTRPTVGGVYDYMRSAVHVDTADLWRGQRPPGRDAAMFDRATVDEALERVRSGEYVDAHVWTFTPRSFLDQIAELRELGLCAWYVERLVEPPEDVEFHAVLRRVRSGAPTEQVAVAELPAGADMPDWLFHEWNLVERVGILESRIAKLRRRNRRLRRRVDDLERSTSPRAGKALAGLRSASGRLRRRVTGGAAASE